MPPFAEDKADRSARVVLVTGGSGGIGRAICLEFARAGWRVGVQYRERDDAAAAVATAASRLGGDGLGLRADVRRRDQVEHMVRTLVERWGGLHVLICGAGTGQSRLVVRTGPEEWDAVIGANLTGAFFCMRAAAEGMLARRDGSIVLVGSFAGAQGTEGQAAYAASKAGLLGLMRTAAREWGAGNVRVNVVLPGWHRTTMTQDVFPDSETFDEHVLHRPPALRDVARTVYHLSQLGDVSGQVWNLDSRIL